MSDTAHPPATMRGWCIRASGQEMVLMDDLPIPTPGPHDILMQMHSAEVGDWDELVRTGEWDMQRPFPLILGLAGAGRIAAVGAAVTGFSENQQVYACNYPLHDNGAWAEFMLVPANLCCADTGVAPADRGRRRADRRPDRHETLTDILRVTRDDVVLINAAAGGVGHIAVQLACDLGAQVVAAASRRNHDFVVGLGATAVIDYDATGDVAQAIRQRYPGGGRQGAQVRVGPSGERLCCGAQGWRKDGPPARRGIGTATWRGHHFGLRLSREPRALDLVLTRHVRSKVVLKIV